MKHTLVHGFLLMEALLAILLMASFSIVAGYYICSLSQAFVKNKQYMHALEFALTTADTIAEGQRYQMSADSLNLKIQRVKNIIPHIIQGPIITLAPIEVMTVTIAWKGMLAWQEIKLLAIAPVQT